jgi:hypothetical protein
MKTTELVLDFLRQQGFCPEVDSENGNLYFKYQMASFIYVDNDDDNDFFQLIMPSIYDVTEENREMVLEGMNKMNGNIKVAKATIINDGVWLFFEGLLDQSPEVKDIMPRALQILQGARQHFYSCME